MFGSTSFTNQPNSTFGSFTAGANTTTPSLFGQTQQNTAMPLFGGTATTAGFNTPMKQTTFGTSFGSTPSNVVTPIFGAAQPNRIAPVSTTGGIFSNPVTGITPFTQGQAQGTSIPFNPLGGTDTMMRNGQPSPISTRHQCITCMKEYDNKSLEELRMEDYQLGRKGSTQTGLFGGVTQQPTSIFAGLGTSTAPTFGQQRTTTFGTPAASTGLFSNLNQPKPQGLFSNTNTGTTFGTPTFSFPTTTTQSTGLMFNQNNTATATSATPFSFNAQPQTQMNLFNTKPLTAPAATTTTFTGFNTTLNKPSGIFASTASAPFGTTNTPGTSTAGTSLFSQPAQAKPFQPFTFNTQPTTQQFGQTPASTFSFSTPTTTTTSISFGTTPAPMFGGATASTGFSFNPNPTTISLGAPATTTTTFPSFSFSNPQQQQPSTGFSFFNNTPGTNTMASTNLQVAPQSTGPIPFATTPYKDSPLFYNVITNRSLEEMTKPTNPLALRAVKEASRRRTSSHLSTSSSLSALGNLTFSTSRNSSYSHKSSIFDGFEEDISLAPIDVLLPKTSIKKLSLKDIPGMNEPPQTSTPPAPKFTPSDSTRAGANNFRGRFSTHSVDYSLNNMDESSLATSLTSASSERQTSATEEPQHQSNNFSSTTPLSTQEPLRGRRHMKSRGYKSNVKCTRAGYYMEPTLDELDALTDEDGQCFLEGFLIGRHNFGSIQFIQPVDVGGLNLDDLVHFRHKETVVYPDDSVKPPVGKGINVPAEITMERIWPVDKSTQEPVKSPERVKALNYEDKLRRSCKRMDAEFISYDAELGVWKFRVKHFSKYTCEPEESEEGKVETLAPVKPRQERSGLGGVNVEEFKSPMQPPALTVKQELEKSSTDFSILKKELGETGKSEFRAYPYPQGIPSPICGEGDNGNGMDDTDSDEDIEFNPLTPSECESDFGRDDVMMGTRKEPLYESILSDRATSPKIGLMRSVLDIDESVDEIAPAKKSRPPRFASSKRTPESRWGRKESDSMYALSIKSGKWGGRPSALPVKQDFDATLSFLESPPPAPRRILKYADVGVSPDTDSEFSMATKSMTPSFVQKTPTPSIQLTSGGTLIVQPKGYSTELKSGNDFRPRQLLQQLTLEDSIIEDRFGRMIKPRMQVRKVIKRRQPPLIAIKRPEDMFAELYEEPPCVPSRSNRGGRVGFGPGGHYLRIRNVRTTRPKGYLGQVNVMRLQPYFEKLETEKTAVKTIQALKRQLELQRQSSELLHEGKFAPCPFGNVASHAEALKDLRHKAATASGTGPRNNNELLEEEEHMWNLCKILWPEDQVEKKFTGRLDRRFCYYQRQALTQWLVADGIGVFRDSRSDNSVTALVRRGEKLKACEEAVEQDNCTLALCMAQNSYDAKETTDVQMLKWEICNAEDFLSPDLKELYQVCSGCPIWARLNLCHMTTTEWLQHFAVYIWYLAPINQSIPRVVELYHRFIKMAIVPADCDTSDLNFPASTHEEPTAANLCVNLLKAYSCSGYPVKKLLSARIRSPDALDYKVSWLLMNNVIRFGFDVETDLFNDVSQSFARQLEALDCFEWAVFVLQHCDPSEETTCLIKRILERNVFKSDDVQLEKFVASFGVNPKAIWEAKVVAAVKKQSCYEEVWYLLKSGRYNEAYQVFVTKSRKSFLSPKKMGSIFTLLEEMAKVSHQIHNWEGYGGALYNLLKAVEEVDGEADFPRERLFPALPEAVASFGRICPQDAIDYQLVVAMGFIIKYLLQVVVDRPPADTLHLIDQMKALEFPSPAPDLSRYPRRLEEYFKQLRFNEAGVQLDKPF